MNNIPSINHAHVQSGRLKPCRAQGNFKIDRGIAINNRIGKFFADFFGDGTVKVDVQGKSCYLNKGSCYKLLNVSKKNAPKTNDELIAAINDVFANLSPTSVSGRPKPSIREEFTAQKEKTRAAKKLCKSYLKDNPPTGSGLASLMIKSQCLNNQRPDDLNYTALKEDLEKNLLLQVQLFSNLYDSSLKVNDDLYISNQIKRIVLDLRNFYASREEALEAIKDNCSPEFLDILSESYPIPIPREKSLAQNVADLELKQQSAKTDELMTECRDYLDGKLILTGNARKDFLARHSSFANERPDDAEYIRLKNELEQNLLSEMKLFSKWYEKHSKDDDKNITDMKYHLMRFYPTRSEALTVLAQNSSLEAHDAIANEWIEITPENFKEERKKWLENNAKILAKIPID